MHLQDREAEIKSAGTTPRDKLRLFVKYLNSSNDTIEGGEFGTHDSMGIIWLENFVSLVLMGRLDEFEVGHDPIFRKFVSDKIYFAFREGEAGLEMLLGVLERFAADTSKISLEELNLILHEDFGIEPLVLETEAEQKARLVGELMALLPEEWKPEHGVDGEVNERKKLIEGGLVNYINSLTPQQRGGVSRTLKDLAEDKAAALANGREVPTPQLIDQYLSEVTKAAGEPRASVLPHLVINFNSVLAVTAGGIWADLALSDGIKRGLHGTDEHAHAYERSKKLADLVSGCISNPGDVSSTVAGLDNDLVVTKSSGLDDRPIEKGILLQVGVHIVNHSAPETKNMFFALAGVTGENRLKDIEAAARWIAENVIPPIVLPGGTTAPMTDERLAALKEILALPAGQTVSTLLGPLHSVDPVAPGRLRLEIAQKMAEFAEQ